MTRQTIDPDPARAAAADGVPTPPEAARQGYGDDQALQERRERLMGANQAFRAVKAQHAARRTRAQAVADHLTRIASSTGFLFFHAAFFVAWILLNVGIGGLRPFDPFPFGLLTLMLSIEAIVLTIFVLMSQGREAAIAELREEITLQVTLRVEQETTKTLQLLAGLYARLGFELGDEPELRDMLRPLDPSAIEKEMEAQVGKEKGSRK